MLNIGIILISSISLIFSQNIWQNSPCSYRDRHGSFWDLTSLKLDMNTGTNGYQYYTIPNTGTTLGTQFYINFCANILSMPNAMTGGSACGFQQTTVCTQADEYNSQCRSFGTRNPYTLTYGYVKYSDGLCYSIGGSELETFTLGNAQLVEFRSEYNYRGRPSKLTMTYNYGDYCGTTNSARNRALNIELICDTWVQDTVYGVESSAKVIRADSYTCDNTIQIRSPHACPKVNGTYSGSNLTDYSYGNFSGRYSIVGSWRKYDLYTKSLYGVDVRVNKHCTEIEFILTSPANYTWFAVGFGGNYSYNLSNSGGGGYNYNSGNNYNQGGDNYNQGGDYSGTNPYNNYNNYNSYTSNIVKRNMNGYAIVSTGRGQNDVWETTLESGILPQRQENTGGTDNLFCTATEMNGIRRNVCKRAYYTTYHRDRNRDYYGEDFWKFHEGLNRIIFAYGSMSQTYGGNDNNYNDYQQYNNNPQMLKHGLYGQGAAKVDYMYMKRTGNLCGYARTYHREMYEIYGLVPEEWMIVGIVFLVLFCCCGCLVIALCIAWRKAKKNNGNGNTSNSSTGYSRANSNKNDNSDSDDQKETND